MEFCCGLKKDKTMSGKNFSPRKISSICSHLFSHAHHLLTPSSSLHEFHHLGHIFTLIRISKSLQVVQHQALHRQNPLHHPRFYNTRLFTARILCISSGSTTPGSSPPKSSAQYTSLSSSSSPSSPNFRLFKIKI